MMLQLLVCLLAVSVPAVLGANIGNGFQVFPDEPTLQDLMGEVNMDTYIVKEQLQLAEDFFATPRIVEVSYLI